MKSRDIGLLAVGLVVGLLTGMLLLSSDDIRDSLFGTAGFSAAAAPSYYLVDTAQSREWLVSTYPEDSAAIDTAFDNVEPLLTTTNFAETVRAAQPDIDLIVSSAYTALTGLTPSNPVVPTPDPMPSSLLQSLSDGNVSTCLGLDENPYNVNGYALYLYVEIPSTQVQFVPESWEHLGGPKEDDLFWQRLACQSLERAQSSGRR